MPMGVLATSPTAGQDSWVQTGTAGTNDLAVSNSATNGSVAMATTGSDSRALVGPITVAPGDKYYLSADIDISAVGSTGDYFFNIGDGSTSNFNGKIFAKSSGTGYVLGASVNTNVAGASFGSTVFTFGSTHRVVLEYDSIAGTANDTAELFVDPTDPILGGGTPYATAAATANDLVTLGAVYLRQGSGGPALTIDNVVLATVPEPASFVLLGLGTLGLAAVSRRRNRR